MEEMLKAIMTKLDVMDNRFDSMDNRFDTLVTVVKGIRIGMETGFKEVHKKLDSLEDICSSHKYDLDLLYDKQNELERKINKVEKIQDTLL